jgi:predicted molibdopterin-dependent oxidoreductase YjgC
MDPREVIGAAQASGFQVVVDGVSCAAYEGDSLAAVLVRAGRRSWRVTRRTGQLRGLYCGIGACQDCLVTVNGVASVRACLDLARAGDVVSTQEGSGRGDLAT